MTQTEYGAITAYMHDCMRDSAHDREHVYRVLYTALDLASDQTGVDLDVLTAASLLHDVGREDQFRDPSVCHAEAGSKKAYAFLCARDWPREKAAHVRDCVLTHRFRTDRRPATLEAKLLFDADKLDVTGAVGVARTLFYGGQTAQPLYCLDPQGAILTGPDTPPSFLREYNFKLRGIGGGLYTERARALAARRRALSDVYYEALLSEVNECYHRGRPLVEALFQE